MASVTRSATVKAPESEVWALVGDFHGLEASTAGAGAEVTWSGSFTPTPEGAEDAVAGIYQAGLDALVERFGG